MKSRSHIIIFVFLSALLLIASSPQTVQAQTQPSVRYIALENANESECTVVWSVFSVSQWADKIHFRLWVIRESEHIPVGFWAIGLSEKLDQGQAQIMPGFGTQGVYAYNVSILQVTAESPFTSEQMVHPIDGLQTYYFYKTHVTFDFTFEDDDILLLAADYENEPDYYDREMPYYGPYNTGDYYRIEYANIPDAWELPPNGLQPTAIFSVSPSMPYATAQITFDASASGGYSTITNYTWDFGDNSVTSLGTPIVTHAYVLSGSYNVTLTVTNEFELTNSNSTDVRVFQDYMAPVTVDNYDGVWHDADFTITLNATDQESGVAETFYQINGSEIMTVSANGHPIIVTEGTNIKLEYWSVDNSGNEETKKVITKIKLDKSPATSSINLSASIGSNGWFTSDVTVTLSATDTTSKVDRIEYCLDNQVWNNYLAPFKITEEGDYSIYYRSIDIAGNVETTNSATAKLDKTTPVSLISVDGKSGNDNWFTSDVTVSLSSTDSVSEVDKTEYSFDNISWNAYSTPLTIADEGVFSIYYRSIDEAGNMETTKTETCKIDKTAPLGYVVINDDAAYTGSERVTLTLSADDTISGVAQMCFSNDGTEWSNWEAYSTSKTWELSEGYGTKTVYVQFKDNTDLFLSTSQDRITLDTINPTANAGQNQTATVNEPIIFNAANSSDNTVIVSYEWNFGDGSTGSGEEITYKYAKEGKYTVKLTVQDIVGNIDTTKITVNVVAEVGPLLLIGVASTATIIILASTWFIWKRKKTNLKVNHVSVC